VYRKKKKEKKFFSSDTFEWKNNENSSNRTTKTKGEKGNNLEALIIFLFNLVPYESMLQ